MGSLRAPNHDFHDFQNFDLILVPLNLFPMHFPGHIVVGETFLDTLAQTGRRGVPFYWLDPAQGTKTRQKNINSYRPLNFVICPRR